jgi:4-hydroxybenzoate polyprenyltransferase
MIVELLRVKQWYKNLVVFLAIFFSANVLNLSMLNLAFLTFIAFCFVSSAGYIINDVMDRKKDREHPEKKHRLIASGKVGVGVALVISLGLLVGGLIISFNVGLNVFYLALSLFGLTLVYTLFLKKVLFADVLTISTLFVIRAVAGAFAISVVVSVWLILCPFFLALFLAVGKRHSDVVILGDRASLTRSVLSSYSSELTYSLMTLSTTLLVISYALYSFLSEYNNLILTLPFAIFVIFRFYYLITSGDGVGRNPEKVIKDKNMLIGMALWIVVSAWLIY